MTSPSLGNRFKLIGLEWEALTFKRPKCKDTANLNYPSFTNLPTWPTKLTFYSRKPTKQTWRPIKLTMMSSKVTAYRFSKGTKGVILG